MPAAAFRAYHRRQPSDPGCRWLAPGLSLPPDPMSAEPARKLNAAQRAALARIESLIEFWRITPDELDGPLPPAPPPPDHPRVKYRHPVSGETWDGEGAQPEWLRLALSKEGYRVAELLPAAQESPPG